MTQPTLFDGPGLRDAGISQVDANTPDAWKEAATRVLLVLGAASVAGLIDTFTAEDLRAVVGDPPNHYNAMGARFMSATRNGWIEPSHWDTASRAVAHACRLRHYVGTMTAVRVLKRTVNDPHAEIDRVLGIVLEARA